MACEFFCIETPLRRFFHNYAGVVARWPWIFVVVPTVLTAICIAGFMNTSVENNVTYLYTPRDAPYKRELKILEELFPLKNGFFEPDRATLDFRQGMLILTAKDDGDMLRPAYISAASAVNSFVIEKVRLFTNGREYKFQDLCAMTVGDTCYSNTAIDFASKLHESHPELLRFPSTQVLATRSYYIARTMGGVDYDNETGVVQSFRAWLLLYQLRGDTPALNELSKKWEKAFQFAMENYRDDLIDISYYHSLGLNEEVTNNEKYIKPKFAITFGVLTLFSFIINLSFLSNRWLIDWTVSKPVLAVCGVITATMGCAAGIGLLKLVGYPYNPVVSVVPFLVVSICSEYMFLLVGAWRRTSRTDPVERRLRESVSIHAVSILLSMLAGALGFGVGAITTIPAMQMFCVYSCVSMLLSMLLQFTFFLGLLALFGQLEAAGRHSLLFCRVVHPKLADSENFLVKLFMLGSSPADVEWNSPSKKSHLATTMMDRFFEHQFSPTLMKPASKALVVVLLIIYLIFGLWGCVNIEEGLKPENLAARDSYAARYWTLSAKHFWPYGIQAQVIVNDAYKLNFSLAADRKKADAIVEAFANTSHTIGRKEIIYFMDDAEYFLDVLGYRSLVDSDPSRFYDVVKRDFMRLKRFEHWTQDIVWGYPNGSIGDATENELMLEALSPSIRRRGRGPVIRSYRFVVGMRHIETTNRQREAMELFRSIAARFDEYNVTTFSDFWQFSDEFRLVLPNTLENIAIALVLVFIVSAVLIPHPLCSLCVALAIVSIDIGVIGFMTWWHVNLDPISMVTIIMSIGFSVDFTAHISYGYIALTSVEMDPVERMNVVIGARGWPVTQACAATILGIIVLAVDTNAYVVITFFKTLFLTMSIGFVHAIIFLPVALDLCIRPLVNLTSYLSNRAKRREQSLEIPVVPSSASEHVDQNHSGTCHTNGVHCASLNFTVE